MSEEERGVLPSLISLMASADVKPHVLSSFRCVSRCGLAGGARLVSRRILVRSASAFLSLLFKNCGLWTLSYYFAHTINETLKWLTQLPTLILNHSGGDSVASRC